MMEHQTIKMKTAQLLLLAIFMTTALLSVNGCYYDIEEEIYPVTGCSLDNVTYSGTVLQIIENNCYVCHDAASNNGNVTLEGYAQLKNYVDNGKLLGAIRHEDGFSNMPQNREKLLDCEIEKIEVWVADGAPNN